MTNITKSPGVRSGAFCILYVSGSRYIIKNRLRTDNRFLQCSIAFDETSSFYHNFFNFSLVFFVITSA